MGQQVRVDITKSFLHAWIGLWWAYWQIYININKQSNYDNNNNNTIKMHSKKQSFKRILSQAAEWNPLTQHLRVCFDSFLHFLQLHKKCLWKLHQCYSDGVAILSQARALSLDSNCLEASPVLGGTVIWFGFQSVCKLNQLSQCAARLQGYNTESRQRMTSPWALSWRTSAAGDAILPWL